MMPPLVRDTHGNRRWIARAIDMAGWTWNPNIIHVGDLGIWPGGHSTDTWDSVEERLAEDNATMYVAPGNHEDYDQIEPLTPLEDGSTLLLLANAGAAPLSGIEYLDVYQANCADEKVINTLEALAHPFNALVTPGRRVHVPRSRGMTRVLKRLQRLDYVASFRRSGLADIRVNMRFTRT